MRAVIIAVASILAFAASTLVTTTDRHHAEHAGCLEQRIAREQGNVRAAHLKLLEGAIVANAEKSQSEIPGYTVPVEVQQLKEHPNEVRALALQKC